MRLIIRLLFLLVSFSLLVNAMAMRDPTMPASYQDEGADTGVFNPQTAKLTSTIVSPHRRIATIDGVPVMVGELFKGAKVRSIERDSVTLEFEGKTYHVQAGTESIRRNEK